MDVGLNARRAGGTIVRTRVSDAEVYARHAPFYVSSSWSSYRIVFTYSRIHDAMVSSLAAVRGARTTARLRNSSTVDSRLRARTTTTTTVVRRAVRVQAAAEDDEVALLEKALKLAKTRKNDAAKSANAAPAASGPGGAYSGASFNVKTFNAISPVGLNKFPKGKYAVSGDDAALPGAPMAMMLRSHKLQVSEVAPTVRGIVRCGAGTNNIPVKEMSDMGIPVFNTPGANANAVKELVVCSLLLASRGIIEGNKHVNDVINVEENGDYAKISTRIEKDKAMFGGTEIEGKTLGVIGLGAIGSRYVPFCCYFVSRSRGRLTRRRRVAIFFFCKISRFSIAMRIKSFISPPVSQPRRNDDSQLDV